MMVTHSSFGLRGLLVLLLFVTACGTFEVGVERTSVPQVTLETTSVADSNDLGEAVEAVAWYGQIESVPGSDDVAANDYLKLWHLNVWPKFGPGVGIASANAAIDAEIDRLRGSGVFATFWGRLTGDSRDFGAYQLLVTHISASDGGPTYEPEPVVGWEGTVGRLPGPAGDDETVRYFVLDGAIPVLYGITSVDPSLAAELERVQDGQTVIRIWGQLLSKAHPTTGSMIQVDRLEVVQETKVP